MSPNIIKPISALVEHCADCGYTRNEQGRCRCAQPKVVKEPDVRVFQSICGRKIYVTVGEHDLRIETKDEQGRLVNRTVVDHGMTLRVEIDTPSVVGSSRISKVDVVLHTMAKLAYSVHEDNIAEFVNLFFEE